MWKCQVCGREFKRKNQSHSCGNQEKTIDSYIAAQPETIQQNLIEVRDMLREVLSDVKEKISWGMPTFYMGQNIIHFAAHKKHLGIYPGPQAIEFFSGRLKDYKFTKGAIQFPYNEKIPLNLIGEIAKWNYETGNHH